MQTMMTETGSKTIVVAVARDYLQEFKTPRVRIRATKHGPYRHVVRGAFVFQVLTATDKKVVTEAEIPLRLGHDKTTMAWKDRVRFYTDEDTWLVAISLPPTAAPGPYVVHVKHRKVVPFWLDPL